MNGVIRIKMPGEMKKPEPVKVSLKQQFDDIEQQTDSLFDLVQKQTDGFKEELEMVYKFTLLYKVFKSMDEGSQEAAGIAAIIKQIKGVMLVDE